MREKQTFRAELEEIQRHFGNVRILNVSDIVKYTGKSRTWVTAHVTRGPMTQVQLAQALTDLRQ